MNSCSEIYTAILLIRDNEISSRNKLSPLYLSQSNKSCQIFRTRDDEPVFQKCKRYSILSPLPLIERKITKRVGLVRSDYIRGGIIRGSEEWRRWIGP